MEEFDVYFAADSRRLKTLFKALTKGKLERPFIVLFNGVDPRSASDIVKENLPLLNKMLSAVIWICAQGSHELHKASLNLQVELLDEELQNEKKASGEFLEDYNKEKRKRIKAEKKKLKAEEEKENEKLKAEEYKKKAEELEREIRFLKEQLSLKEGKEEEKKAEEEKQALERERRLPKKQLSKKAGEEEEEKLTPVIIKKALSNSKLPPKSQSYSKTHIPKK